MCVDSTKNKGSNNAYCSSGAPLLPPYPFERPLAVHPIQVISILQRSTAKAKANSNRECVVIRAMKSRAYGAPPPHYWAAMGSRLEPLPAFMFEREKENACSSWID